MPNRWLLGRWCFWKLINTRFSLFTPNIDYCTDRQSNDPKAKGQWSTKTLHRQLRSSNTNLTKNLWKRIPAPHVASIVLLLLQPGDKSWMRKGHDCDNKLNTSVVICDSFSVTVNQVMVATVKLSKWWLQFNH